MIDEAEPLTEEEINEKERLLQEVGYSSIVCQFYSPLQVVARCSEYFFFFFAPLSLPFSVYRGREGRKCEIKKDRKTERRQAGKWKKN